MILALLLAAAPSCQLADKKADLADGRFGTVTYEAACASVGAAFLASDDPIERAAAARYGAQFKPAGKKTVNVPFVSDFVGPITLVHYQHYFSLTKDQRARILARAPTETNPRVVLEQLRHFGALAGTEASLALLRASPLVVSDAEVRKEALSFWRYVPPKRLRAEEIAAAWGFDQPPDVRVNRPTAAARATDATSAAVIADAKAFIAEKKGDCFFLTPKLEAGWGHLPTLLGLAEAVQGCSSAFTVMVPLAEGLARTPDPEAAVLAALPAFANIPKGTCRVVNELIAAVPLDAKPSTYLALADAFDPNAEDSCLWTASEPLAERLALTTATPEGVAAVVALARRLVARNELWRHGDRLVYALAYGKSDRAAEALATVVALEAKRTPSIPWAAHAEAAAYHLGGPQAEKRAAAMRRYVR